MVNLEKQDKDEIESMMKEDKIALFMKGEATK